MATLDEIKAELEEIRARNRRVEADKAWEVSWARKLLISVLTYLVIVVFFFVAELPKPFTNSLVPSIAFILSTLTAGCLKKYWIKNVL